MHSDSEQQDRGNNLGSDYTGDICRHSVHRTELPEPRDHGHGYGVRLRPSIAVQPDDDNRSRHGGADTDKRIR